MRRCEDGIPSPVMWSVGLYLVIYCDLAGVHLFFEYALLSTRQMRQGAMNWGLVKAGLDNEEQRVGAEIVRRALPYSLKLIARNAGTNGSVVVQKVVEAADTKVGYNAATGAFEDMFAAGIIDPAKVVRCALENAASVARTFLMSDVVVTDIPEPEPVGAPAGADAMGGY